MAEILDEIPDDDTERVIEYSGGYESFLGSLVFGGFESDSDDGDDESSEESDEQDSNEPMRDEPTRDEPTRDEQKEQLKKKKDLEESQSEESQTDESQSEESQSEESQSDELESELVEKEVELVSEFVGGQTKKAKKQESTRQTEHNEVVSREAKHNEDVSQEAKHNEDVSQEAKHNEYDSEFLDKPCGCSSEIVAEDQEDVVNSEFLSEDPDLGDKPVSVNQEKMEMLKELVNDNPDTSSEDELDSEYVKSEGQTQELNTKQTQELNHEQTQEPNTKEPSDSDSESSSESDTGSVQITKELPKKQPKKGGNPTVFAALQSYLN